ncbi:phosphonate C-P lyase system protein PhnH [Phenylobacterium sp.]|uniref:phosphonate C-P lyase system protein PhnH n=1 Tax=Phenylobacterium sp. TaxID=1871053 RepID=UPI00286BF9E0|nr:phosphonate C-P lyase system protein PhnH [Phenylobacterium sp.]
MSLAPVLDLAEIAPAFADPTRESQAIFRRVMDAMARPGTIQDLPFAPDAPEGLDRAAGAVALTLFDFETPVWLAPALTDGPAERWLRFHAGCPLTAEPMHAAFALVTDLAAAPPLSAFNPGDAKYPDRSTTLVIQLPALTGGARVTLRGPGIKDEASLTLAGLPEGFWTQVQANHETFQFGVDLIFVAGDRLTALPRSTRVTITGD